ncbi:MAG: sugar transferase [Anaerolineaceae bacterium]|nr:sugar transferase [Anaerolineaceae bacterium]
MSVERINSKSQWRIRVRERRFILLFGDLFVTYLSVFIALVTWAQKDWLDFSGAFLIQRPPFWFYLLPFLWIFIMMDLYDIRRASRRKDTLGGVATAAIISLLIYMVLFFISDPNSLPRRGVLIFVICATVLTIAWRFLYIRVFTAPIFMRRALIIGAGKAGSSLAKMINEVLPSPYQVVGFIDDDPAKVGLTIEGFAVLGSSQKLLDIIADLDISDLIFSISGEVNDDLFRNIITAEEQGIEVTSLPVAYEELFGRVPIFLLQSDWILRTFFDELHTTSFYETLKRLMDILGALIGLLFLVLLFPLIALIIVLDSGFPIFYHQPRVGKNGLPYKIYKFRTMVRDAEKNGARTATEHDARITPVGRWLRKSHLDELPQVINILKGEMSLVGPRSEQIELVNQFQKQIPFYRARLFVSPGLTGWAQINQRYATTVEDTAVKIEYDLFYIKHRSLMLDLTIIIRTVGAVIGFKGL